MMGLTMKKDKTILFIMPRMPFPACSGRKTSLYHYCRILSEGLGYRLVVAAFSEKGDDPSDKPDFIDRLVVLPESCSLRKISSVFVKSLVLRKMPMQTSLYRNIRAKKIIDNIYREECPDIVIGDMVRSTEYIRYYDTFKIADLDDRISLRYKRQLGNSDDIIDPYGAFIDSVPMFLRKILQSRAVKLSVLKNEIKLLEKYELEIGSVCDKTVFVAQKEADEFNEQLGIKKAVSIPTGVDTGYFCYRECSTQANNIGFLGALNVAHNESAVRHFVNNIFPLILEKIPDAKFIVTGGGASDGLRSLADDNILFTGRVDDVREYLSMCRVFVCPMTVGSGIKTKNLEAMAMGLPVVTTSVGAENINAVNDKDWIIADDAKEFADAVSYLFQNESKRKMIGKNGSTFVNENFTWEISKKRFELLLKSDSINE